MNLRKNEQKIIAYSLYCLLALLRMLRSAQPPRVINDHAKQWSCPQILPGQLNTPRSDFLAAVPGLGNRMVAIEGVKPYIRFSSSQEIGSWDEARSGYEQLSTYRFRSDSDSETRSNPGRAQTRLPRNVCRHLHRPMPLTKLLNISADEVEVARTIWEERMNQNKSSRVRRSVVISAAVAYDRRRTLFLAWNQTIQVIPLV